MSKLSSVLALVVFLAATALAGPSLAQTDTEALEEHMRQVRRKVAEKRDSAMSTLMVMTAEQSKAFRPLQKAYTKEQKALDKKDREMIAEFGEVFDKLDAETAAKIGKRFFDIERDRLALQEKYLKQISDAVSPVIAVQFIQLERRFQAQLENERMKYSPLAE